MHRLTIPRILVIAAFIATAFLLVALYLPLPKPQMPIASEVYDREHHLVTTFFTENRRPVSLSEIPFFLRRAFLAVEDHRFYQHHGINLGRIFKAAWYDLLHRSLDQGASTITQQLAKNAYLSQERTFYRKIRELYLTVKLELHLSKDQILEMYLNQICFGHGAYGVKTAAETYFNKSLAQLNEAEMALLAGLPKEPAYYSPYSHPDAARRRIHEVLGRMLACNYLSTDEYRKYNQMPLNLPGLRGRSRPAPYFLETLQDEIKAIFPKEPGLIDQAGLKIESTLDLTMQKAAEQAVIKNLPRLTRDQHGLIQPQCAMIAIDPTTGEIRALLGGTDYNQSQFNRATQAKRQPGSAFKPILYQAALEHGYTLASIFDRTPETYHLGTQVYRPLDHDQETLTGTLSLRDALASSSNVVSVKLIHQLGVKPVLKLAAKLGIHSRLPAHLSLALGTGEVTPWELVSAYLPLANNGIKPVPHTVRRILDNQGRVIYQAPDESSPAVNPGVAFLVTQALTGVFQEGGTAANIGSVLGRPAAGKTGTTEENRDAWFVGYTPDLLTGVYVGCDHNERSLPGSANRIAAPIWADFMVKALAPTPARDFPIPGNVTQITVCKETGAKATSFCPSRQEFFLSGTEPEDYCQKHRFIDLEICQRSGLLAGPFCRHREVRRFRLGEQPEEVCRECKKPVYFFDWLRRFLGGHR